MASEFQAFTVQTTLDNFQKKIEAVESVQNGVLAGLVDGTLVLLKPDPANDDAKWQVSQAYRNICKRNSTQIQVRYQYSAFTPFAFSLSRPHTDSPAAMRKVIKKKRCLTAKC